MGKVKVFVTDRRTDGRTDWLTDRQTDEWDLMSPRFRESGGQQKWLVLDFELKRVGDYGIWVGDHGIWVLYFDITYQVLGVD